MKILEIYIQKLRYINYSERTIETYPFSDDFLEISYDMAAWVDELVERLKQ